MKKLRKEFERASRFLKREVQAEYLFASLRTMVSVTPAREDLELMLVFAAAHARPHIVEYVEERGFSLTEKGQAPAFAPSSLRV